MSAETHPEYHDFAHLQKPEDAQGIEVAQSAGIVGMRPTSGSYAMGSQQLLLAPDMARSSAPSLPAMEALHINQQPLSTADGRVQQVQEATFTHPAATAQSSDSIAELILFTYILRCSGVLDSGWRVHIDKRNTFICYPPQGFVPANGEKLRKKYTHRTNVARAMGLTPFGARKRKRPTDVPATADGPAAAAAAPATPVSTEHGVQQDAGVRQPEPGVTHSQPCNQKRQKSHSCEAASKAEKEHRAAKRQRTASASTGNSIADGAPAPPRALEEHSSGPPLLPDHNDAAADVRAQPDLDMPEDVLQDMLETICADLPPPRNVPAAEPQQGQCCPSGQTAQNAGQATPCGGTPVPDRNLAGGPEVAELLKPCWDAPACAAPSPDAEADADADADMDDDRDDGMDDDMDDDMDRGADSPPRPLERGDDLRSLPPAVLAEKLLRGLLKGDPQVGKQPAATNATAQHAAEVLRSNAGFEDPDESTQAALAVSSVEAAHVYAVDTTQDERVSAACSDGHGISAVGNALSAVPGVAPQPLMERPARSAVAFRLSAARRPLKDTCVKDFEEMVHRGLRESSPEIAEALAYLHRDTPSLQSRPLQDVGIQVSKAAASRDAGTSKRADTYATPVIRPASGPGVGECAVRVSVNEAGVDAVGCRDEPGSGQQGPEPAGTPTEAASMQVPRIRDAGVQGFGAEVLRDEAEPGEGAVLPQASAAMSPQVEPGAGGFIVSSQQHDGARSTEMAQDPLSLAGWIRTTEALTSCAAAEDTSGGCEPVRSREQEPMHLNADGEPAGSDTHHGFTLVNVDRLHVGRPVEEGRQLGKTTHEAPCCQSSRAVSPVLGCEESPTEGLLDRCGRLSGGKQPGQQRSDSQEQQGDTPATDRLTGRCNPHLPQESGMTRAPMVAAVEGRPAKKERSSAIVLTSLKSTSNAAAEFAERLRAAVPAHTTVGKCVPDQASVSGGNNPYMLYKCVPDQAGGKKLGKCAPDQARASGGGSLGAGLMADCHSWQVPRVLQVSKGVQHDPGNDMVVAEREIAARIGTSSRSSQLPAVRSGQSNHAVSSQLSALCAGQKETSGIALLQQYVSQSATSAAESSEQASLSEHGDRASPFAALEGYASDSVSAESAREHSRTSLAGAKMQSEPRGNYTPSEPSQLQSPESSWHIELALSDAEAESKDTKAQVNGHQSKPGNISRMQKSEDLGLHLNLPASESVKPSVKVVWHAEAREAAQADNDDDSSTAHDGSVLEHFQEYSSEDSPTVLLRDLARTAAKLKESEMQLHAQAPQQDPARERRKQLVHDRIACFVEHLKAAKLTAEGVLDWQ